MADDRVDAARGGNGHDPLSGWPISLDVTQCGGYEGG
jgi:hypothetical protein